jgi:hypothetical protein
VTVTAQRSSNWLALAERAERARSQARTTCETYQNVVSRTGAVHPGGSTGHRKATAAEAAKALIMELEQKVDGLNKRLESQAPVEQAKGIIMAQTHCDADQAFEILRRASQRSNTKLRLLAEDLITRTTTKVGHPADHSVAPTFKSSR